MTAHKQATAALKTAGFATNTFRVYTTTTGKNFLRVHSINIDAQNLILTLIAAGFELVEQYAETAFIVKVAA